MLDCDVFAYAFILFYPEEVQQQLPNGQIGYVKQMRPHLFRNKDKFSKALTTFLKAHPDQPFQVQYSRVPISELDL